MLSTQGLRDFFEMQPAANGPELLVYAEQTTARLDQTCSFIFHHVLGIHYRIVNDPGSIRQGTPMVNYSTVSLNGGLQIIPASLLFEKGVNEIKPAAKHRNGNIYFYADEEPGNDRFHFDVFSAVFYFISRYEEWQSFDADKHGRFEAVNSLLFQNNTHLKPVVDLWIMEFAAALRAQFPSLVLKERSFKLMSTIDVDNLYAYKAKGFLRTAGAAAKDLLKGDLKNLKERLAVVSGKKKDPFDIYESVSDLCFEQRILLVYFFLFRTGTTFDRTVDPDSPAFKEVFRRVDENHAVTGIHPSYDASADPAILKREVRDLAQKSGKQIRFSRQHFLRFKIRSTPKELMAEGIEVDFSMGFASEPGFRAGTSHPFFYYDLGKETSTTFLFVPFCVMDGVYTVYKHIPAEQALKAMLGIAAEVQRTNGNFISVFHERSFSDHLYPGFGTLYKNLHLTLKELSSHKK